MQVSVETTSGLERLMTISVPAERIDQDVNKRIQQTARTAKIDGFRPGKVPVKVVKQRYGKGIREEVLGQVVQESFYQALQQEEINPAGTPAIDFTKDVEGESLEYTAKFEVYPTIELADFSGVEIEKKSAEVKEADLDQMIETLRKQQADWTEVEREAADGDRLNINFEGFVDGEAFDGGKGEGMDLVLGSNTMIPGFESGLVGAKAGAEVELNVTFPETYQAENLQGKDAVFKVTVATVSEQVLAELNEEFFAKFGLEEKTEEAFRAEVSKNMTRELNQSLKMKLKDQVFSQLLEVNGIEVPTALIDSEIDNLRRQAVMQFAGPDSDMDPNALPKEMFTDQADRRVKIGLLMQEVIKVNELEADDARVTSTLEEMAETYQDPQQVIDWYMGNEEMLGQIKGLVLEEQVVDLLLETAKVAEVEVSYEEAIKQEQPAA
ncbi:MULTISPECIES: trigger factor [unclassified Neptuniibacter]|uniref:trigger factor n=1 Tax=unclassified Neptuniibacter TaxID=2630693 RepID=UPI000C3C058C|nr:MULTISPECIES: trigger factor [unclassified Neptuniibacter]MAY43367.1 trigger factor [Oceanospirillaceae bacterium]|tara:strand:+ start:376 stop:1689 length:1314 start_codon:yes stop_codon:yes gene_type:complete